MAKTKTTTIKAKGRAAKASELGPGLHAVTIELASGGACRVRTPRGESVAAVLADGLDPAFVEECLRARRVMIATDGERGPTILGALQTSSPVVRDHDGAIAIRGREVRLIAEEDVVLDAGASSLRLERAGGVRVEGDKMVIDMASLIRLLATRTEFP